VFTETERRTTTEDEEELLLDGVEVEARGDLTRRESGVVDPEAFRPGGLAQPAAGAKGLGRAVEVVLLLWDLVQVGDEPRVCTHGFSREIRCRAALETRPELERLT
jgi:hypothetical protein